MIKACLPRSLIYIWDTAVVILNVVSNAISPMMWTTLNNIKKNFISSKIVFIVSHPLMQIKSKNMTKVVKQNQLLVLYASYLFLYKYSRAIDFNANLEHQNAKYVKKLYQTGKSWITHKIAKDQLKTSQLGWIQK